MDESIAQDQQVVADNTASESQDQGAGSQQFAGFQKRLDEMTAKFYRAQESFESQLAQKDALISDMVANITKPTAPVQQVDVDPELARQMNAYMAPQVAQMQKTMHQLQSQLEQSQFQQELQAVPPEVADNAKKLLAHWKSNNLSGYNMRDAVVYAMGQAAMNGGKTQARDTRGRYNAGADTLGQASAPPPPSGNSQKADPPDIDSWHPAKQAEYWAKKLGDSQF